MKKLSKFIYFIFAFALIACMAIFNPAITFVDAEESPNALENNEISISTSKIASTVEAGKNLIIPMPTVSSNIESTATKYIVVKDRSGKTYTYNCSDGKTYNEKNEESTVKYFTLLGEDGTTEITDTSDLSVVKYIQPTIIGKGTYSVQYKVVNDNKTYYSDAQLVQVKGVVYSWQFNADNTAKNIIPSITNANSEYVLPLPTIVNSDDNTNIPYTTDDLLENDKGEWIIITKGSGADVTKDVTRIEGGKIYFSPTLDASEDTATYTIKYKSKVQAFADRAYTVKVERSYNTEAKLEVTHNSITGMQVGAVTTFPTANVTDKTHNKSNVEVNTVITIKEGANVVKVLEPNQYTYTFEKSGNYTVYYEVTDAYGNKATSSAYSFTVSNKVPYLVSYADNYTVENDEVKGEVAKDVDYLVPSEVGYNGFKLPAIYAEDYVSAYGDITFERRLELSTDSKVYFNLDVSAEDDAEHGNAALAKGATPKYNESVYFQFPTTELAEQYAGCTFKLKYSAKGVGDSEAYATIYTIKIAEVDVLATNVDKNLIVNLPTINSAIDPNAELTFTAASGKEEPTNSNQVADERVEVRTYYYYGDKSQVENALKTYKQGFTDEKYLDKYGYDFDRFIGEFAPSTDANFSATTNKLTSKDGKTTLTLSNYTDQEMVTIFAVAINDQGQFVIKAREVAINNTDETGVPYILSSTDTYDNQLNGKNKFNQNYEVKLPSVVFRDDIDESLQVEVKCYVNTPDQTVGVTIDQFVQDTINNQWGIQTARLTTTYAGTYYVVYTATDDAGNKITYVSTFEVANTEKAYIEVENGSNISKNVGEEVVFNINLAGNGEYENVVTNISWGENKPSGLGSLPNSFKFDKAGTYIATISATYTMNGSEPIQAEPSVTVTVTVTEPDLTWESDIDKLLVNRTADVGDKVELPVVSATENGVEINATPKVVFIDENDKETEVEVLFDETTFNNYYFVADKDGVYKVTYTATTDYDSESKSFNVTCGDYYDPIIIIDSNKLQDSKITYKGTDINVTTKLTREEVNGVHQDGKYILTVTATEGTGDDAKQVFSYDIKVSFKDMKADKSTVDLTTTEYSFELTGDNCSSKGTNSWTISGVGSYELKLTVRDANGNATTKSINFSVASKTEPKKVKDNVVGIVLIVVSVVILGGVILFFALAGKRNKSKRITVKTEKKD